MNTLTVTFASSSSDATYDVRLIGQPVSTLTCSCPGYQNQKSCKHITAILEGDYDLTEPAPIAGYDEALDAIAGSPVRVAYERLINGLLTIDEKISVLKTDAKLAKKIFYRMLSEGIS